MNDDRIRYREDQFGSTKAAIDFANKMIEWDLFQIVAHDPSHITAIFTKNNVTDYRD